MKPFRGHIAVFLGVGLVAMTWAMGARAADSSSLPAPSVYGLSGPSVGDKVLETVQGRGLSLHLGKFRLLKVVILWDEPSSRNGSTNPRISIVSGEGNRQNTVFTIVNH